MSGIKVESEKIYLIMTFTAFYRSRLPFRHRRYTRLVGMDFVCNLYISLGQNRSGICQQSNSKDIEPCDGSDPGDIGSCGYGIFDDRLEL